MRLPLSVLLMLILCSPALAEPKLVAHWTFDEGKGDSLTDQSGNDNHGKVHGAKWSRGALQFDGNDDYVDCGQGASLDLHGPLTLEAWVNPDGAAGGEPGIAGKFYESYAITYYRGGAWFYISGGGNNLKQPMKVGQWQHMVGVFDGTQMRVYQNGELKQSKKSLKTEVNSGGRFYIGCVVGDADNPDEALRNTAFFAGAIDEVRVYDGALSDRQVIDSYNRHAAAKGQTPFDTSNFGKILLQSYVYESPARAMLDVNYRWVRPLPEGAAIKVELLSGGKALQSQSVKPESVDDTDGSTFALDNVEPGDYVLRAAVVDGSGKPTVSAEREFTWPLPQSRIGATPVAPLPRPVAPPTYQHRVDKDGRIIVTVAGKSFHVGSTWSHPAGGPQYTHKRTITKTPSRLEISDTFTNNTDDVIGIILSNHVDTRNLDNSTNSIYGNPTVFVADGGAGVGLLALDDLYQLRSKNGKQEGIVFLRDEHVGIDKGGSHTVKWAIYPNATGDYYDFINQIRRDHKLHGHVPGGFAFTSHWSPITKETRTNLGLSVISWASLTKVLRNPTISVEGWEFMEFPELCDRIRRWTKDTKRHHPDLITTFHVAHSLFATNRPKDKFPDSLAIDSADNMLHYGPNTMDYYGKYFDKAYVEDNWRWWIYYPTEDNSFGKYMLNAADYMINDLGCKTIWADGWISGYVRDGYTFDFWDGNSVTIDPDTKKVTRKKACVPYVALPVLTEVTRKFEKAGGMVISNGRPGPLSYQREAIVTSCETGGGDQQPIAGLFLSNTVTPLGNPSVIKSERDVYKDILAKLDLGALYFWYGGTSLVTEPTIVSNMYPITFESIHPGTVRGRERIVTKVSGVYGWHGDRSLHAVYPYDSRGGLLVNSAVTTVDATSVRTQLDLADNESAVVKKIPLTLNATGTVNLILRQYDSLGVHLLLNGNGKATLHLQTGDFVTHKNLIYRVLVNGKPTDLAPYTDDVTVPITLVSETTVRITHRAAP